MDYGEKTRRIRVFLNIGQVELSVKSGVNRSDLSLFEGGKKPLSDERVGDICEALGVSSLDAPLPDILISLAQKEQLALAA